jgi:hypothetical protein
MNVELATIVPVTFLELPPVTSGDNSGWGKGLRFLSECPRQRESEPSIVFSHC